MRLSSTTLWIESPQVGSSFLMGDGSESQPTFSSPRNYFACRCLGFIMFLRSDY